MSVTAAALLVGVAAFVLLAMLMVVGMSRRMDKGHSAVRVNLPTSLARALDINARTPSGNGKRARRGIAVTAAIIAAVIGLAVALDADGDDLVEQNAMTHSEIAAGNLHGTMVSPGSDAPVVLMAPGSGPTDRDGNSGLGIRTNMYKLLAEGLAEKGIASVRVDKRGMFGSAAAGNANAVTVDLYAEDYRNWIDAIRAETGVDCVWLLGHSEGALMVSAAAQGREDVCGLILVAGMGRKMGDVLRQQLQANPANAPLLDQAFAAISDLEAGRHTDTSSMHPALLPLFAPQVQDFLLSVFAVDPVEAVRLASAPTLVVQGATDLQVTVEDARLLDQAPNTHLALIEGMNHVLKAAPADRAANLATYANPDLPLHPQLVDTIADFIKD